MGNDTWQSLGLLALRLAGGGMLVFLHGLQKLLQFSEKMHHFPDPLGVSSPVSLGLTVFAEFFCGLAVLLGLFTRFAAIPVVITMTVAVLLVHKGDPWSEKELALMYLAPFLALATMGGGKYSMDRLLGRAK